MSVIFFPQPNSRVVRVRVRERLTLQVASRVRKKRILVMFLQVHFLTLCSLFVLTLLQNLQHSGVGSFPLGRTMCVCPANFPCFIFISSLTIGVCGALQCEEGSCSTQQYSQRSFPEILESKTQPPRRFGVVFRWLLQKEPKWERECGSLNCEGQLSYK